MGTRDQLTLGLWNVICDRCGFKYKNNEVRKTWDNLIVCEPCFETRHPQDFVRSKPDEEAVAFTRPDRDLNNNGQPVNDVSPSFNCTTIEAMFIPNIFTVNTLITKAYTIGPVIISSGTVTIRCSLEVR